LPDLTADEIIDAVLEIVNLFDAGDFRLVEAVYTINPLATLPDQANINVTKATYLS
jgi:hypothetical protein